MAATDHSQQIKHDSQQYLIAALLQLLKNNRLNDISVTQVVKRAGVSRMAFYRNFETLDDILIAYFKPRIDEEFENIINRVPQEQKMSALGNFFTELSDNMNLAVKGNFEYIIQNIFNDNMANFYNTSMDWEKFTEVQKKYWVKFMSAGVYAIWREWLLDGQTESLDDIHTILADFQVSTLQALSRETKK